MKKSPSPPKSVLQNTHELSLHRKLNWNYVNSVANKGLLCVSKRVKTHWGVLTPEECSLAGVMESLLHGRLLLGALCSWGEPQWRTLTQNTAALTRRKAQHSGTRWGRTARDKRQMSGRKTWTPAILKKTPNKLLLLLLKPLQSELVSLWLLFSGISDRRIYLSTRSRVGLMLVRMGLQAHKALVKWKIPPAAVNLWRLKRAPFFFPLYWTR